MVRRSFPVAFLVLVVAPAVAFAAASLTTSPQSIDFGDRCLRSSAGARTITVTNEGDGDATSVAVTLEPEEAGSVFRLRGTLEMERLPIGEELGFRAGFTPLHVGDIKARAVIRYGTPRAASSATPSPSPKVTSTAVALAGEGIDRFIATSPRAVDFGKLRMGRSRTRTIRIFDDGETPLDISSVSIGGRHAADFRIIDQPQRTITDEDPTRMRVRFKPRTSGARAGELIIRSNSCEDDVLRVPLGGLSIEPVIRIEPENVDFGAMKLDGSRRKRLTITNDGEQTLRIRDMTFTAEAPDVYRLDGFPKRFPLELKPHRSKTMSVLFRATKPGPVEASLVVSSNDRDDRIMKVKFFGAAIVPAPSASPSAVAPPAEGGSGFNISFDRYASEIVVIGGVAGFFLLLVLIRRLRGVPE